MLYRNRGKTVQSVRREEKMDLEEIEQKIYINTMRLKSIEANFENVAPYSSEFDSLMGKALEIKEELDRLTVERIRLKFKEHFEK
jgi:KaiC/GvpD/RAD55 family RecA-like ATPase